MEPLRTNDSDSTARSPSALGLAAALAGLVLWALLGGIPLGLAVARTRSLAGNEAAAFFALVSLVALCSLGPLARSRPAHALALALAFVPTALALEGVALGARSIAQFDPPTRWLAAACAAVYTCLCAAWSGGLPQGVPSASSRPSASLANRRAAGSAPHTREGAPPLRAVAPAALLAVASLLGVVLPSLVSHESTRAGAVSMARPAGALLARARDALTAAGGLAVALLLVLYAGSSLVRAGPASTKKAAGRRGRKALALLLWAATLALLLVVLRRSR